MGMGKDVAFCLTAPCVTTFTGILDVLYSTKNKKNEKIEESRTAYHRSNDVLHVRHRKLRTLWNCMSTTASSAAVIGDRLLSVLTQTYGWGTEAKAKPSGMDWETRHRKPSGGNLIVIEKHGDGHWEGWRKQLWYGPWKLYQVRKPQRDFPIIPYIPIIILSHVYLCY